MHMHKIYKFPLASPLPSIPRLSTPILSFRFGKRFETVLLVQSVVMTTCMILMLEISVRMNKKHVPKGQRKSIWSKFRSGKPCNNRKMNEHRGQNCIHNVLADTFCDIRRSIQHATLIGIDIGTGMYVGDEIVVRICGIGQTFASLVTQ